MKITLGQINTTPGDFEGNVAQIIAGIEKAAEEEADMVVFPELSIPGYLSCDKMFQKHYVQKNRKYLHDLITLSAKYPDLFIVVGYIGQNNEGHGKPFANLLAVLNDGTLVGKYQKQLLPFYDVFDEGRYYEPGNRHLVLEIADMRVGFTICEDLWNDKNQDDYNYRNNPVSVYRDELDVDMIVNISSSPFAQNKPRQRNRMLAEICGRGKYIVYVNQQGGQDELVFDGRSCVFKDSSMLYQIPSHHKGPWCDPQYHTVDTSKSCGYQSDKYEFDVYNMVVMGLRDYIQKCGFKGVVVGSSGGIDSAVVLALASDAIGAENVNAIMMPSKWSSEGSVKDAQKLHTALGCNEFEVPIEHVQFLEHINAGLRLTEGEYNSVANQNIQARLRGMVVMHYSNATGALPLTTGNKTECAVGYCTLYGDMNGGFNPLKDLYKMEVYALARYINKLHGREVIPEEIINKAPSAELEPGQTDEENLLPYPILDSIVKSFVEDYVDDTQDFAAWLQDNNLEVLNAIADSEFQTWAEFEKDYDRIIRRINLSEFKRRQAAPGVKISKVAFGTGRRLPIVAK